MSSTKRIASEDGVPRAFPAKLAKLLHARFRAGAAPLTIFPCELIEQNGDRLRDLALQVAERWRLGADFERWAGEDCLWINSLVDRIVSEPLEPAGAVAEPYALWAVENRPGLVMPCKHPAIVVTDDLKRYERLKLFILNLGHTYLAEGWAARGAEPKALTRELLADPAILADLEDLYEREVQPVFDALGLGAEARDYRASVLTRFRNPVPRPLSRRHFPQSRGEETAAFRRADRARARGAALGLAAPAASGARAVTAAFIGRQAAARKSALLAAGGERVQCPRRLRPLRPEPSIVLFSL